MIAAKTAFEFLIVYYLLLITYYLLLITYYLLLINYYLLIITYSLCLCLGLGLCVSLRTKVVYITNLFALFTYNV